MNKGLPITVLFSDRINRILRIKIKNINPLNPVHPVEITSAPLCLCGKNLNLKFFFVALWLCAISFVGTCFAQEVKPQAWPTVGIEAGVSVELPRGDLEAVGIKERTDLILRIASIKVAKQGFGYDLRYIGLLPGDYNLANYLLTPEGHAAEALPMISVKVLPLLPQGHQGELVSSQLKAYTPPGGYRLFFSGVWLLWLLLLLPLIFAGRVKQQVQVVTVTPPPTLEEQIQPLVKKALAGGLDISEKEHLERLLMGYWQQKLGCDEATAYLMLRKIKGDPEGGQLFEKLESWLHRPPGTASVQLEEMLARYAHLAPPAEGKAGNS
jgi:hypothetical protein